jgi:hypothetical protein
MRAHIRAIPVVVCLFAFAAAAPAQLKEGAKDAGNSPLVTKMMAFDKNKDGKLTKDEVTDERLHRLFDEADANHDGVVTKDELMALAAKRDAEFGSGDRRGGFRGPGGPGPRGRGGPGGPPFGGPGGPPFGGPGFGPPPPGLILPPMLQDMLNLSDEQKKKVGDLQKEIDDRLAKILNEDQLKQLKQMRDRGPRGPGRNGGQPPPPPREQE